MDTEPISTSGKKSTGSEWKDKIRCHKCGKLGHKMAQCKQGGTSTADSLTKALSDLRDRADGNAVAAREASVALKDVEQELLKKEKALKQAEDELLVSRAARQAAVEGALTGASFKVVIGESVGFNWAWAQLFILLLGLCMMHAGFLICGLVPLWLVGIWRSYEAEPGDDENKAYLRAVFVEWIRDPTDDLRHDAHSLQKLKHALPLLCKFQLTRDETEDKEEDDRTVVVSGELLMQLMSGHNTSYIAEPKVVHERLFRSACGNQTINIPRTFIAESVHNNSAAVAWIAWQSQQANELLDFVNRPHQWDEVSLPVPNIKRDVEISVPREVDLLKRPPVNISLGCHLDGAALPHCDPQDPWTMVAGTCKRFAVETPEIDLDLLKEFRSFVAAYVEENYTPLAADTDVSVETWLEGTSYPLWRKEELRKKWSAITDFRSRSYYSCSSFMKDEGYCEWKHARGINSRSDEFKCMVGPIFKAIESVIYKDHQFIKHVPVAQRPKYIRDLLGKFKSVYASDFTAFEALFVKAIMESCEFVLYEHMTKNLPEGAAFMRLCREVLAGRNTCNFRDFTVWVEAVRMSGEMCTSLGNGFTNKMLHLFLCRKAGATEVECVVEGDDGLIGTNGPLPTAADFARLGMIIKLEPVQDVCEASFCGLVFDPEDLINISEPYKVLAQFGWSCAQYRRSSRSVLDSLLRCKALSLAHIYPGCPIISELAQYGLRVTAHVGYNKLWKRWNRKDLNMWERERLKAILEAGEIKPVEPPMNTRFLMERKFGVSVETQLSIEAYLRKLDRLQPIVLDRELLPSSWRQYWDQYVRAADTDYPDVGHIRTSSGCPPCLRMNEKGRLVRAAD